MTWTFCPGINGVSISKRAPWALTTYVEALRSMVSPSGRRQRTVRGTCRERRTVRRRSGYRVLCISGLGRDNRGSNRACCHVPGQKTSTLTCRVKTSLKMSPPQGVGEDRAGNYLESKCGDHRIREFVRPGLPADVARRVLCLAINPFERILDPLRCRPIAEVVEHEIAAHQQRRRIREALAGDVGRGTVHGFEHRAFIADIGAGHDTQAADEARSQVAHDVAIEIREQE